MADDIYEKLGLSSDDPEEFLIKGRLWREMGPNDGYPISDFVANLSQGNFIYLPLRQFWPKRMVDAVVPPMGCYHTDGVTPETEEKKDEVVHLVVDPSAWLVKFRRASQLVWSPGESDIIRDKLIGQYGWKYKRGAAVYNQYVAPDLELGDASQVYPWTSLVHELFPDIADNLIACFAQRRQRPWEKINYMAVLIGQQGIGKDTILEAVKMAIGPDNYRIISTRNLTNSFDPWKKSVMLNINETEITETSRNDGRATAIKHYEQLKPLAAEPPHVLYINEKYLRQQWIPNVTFPIITSNQPYGEFYIPAEDRRTLVSESPKKKGWKDPEFFKSLYKWYAEGGYSHVAAYLQQYDLSKWNFKAEPVKTQVWHAIVQASYHAVSNDLMDLLEGLGMPDVVSIDALRAEALKKSKPGEESDLLDLLTSTSNAKRISRRLNDVGYKHIANPGARDGRWKVKGKSYTMYGKHGQTAEEMLKKVGRLARQMIKISP